MKPKKPLFWHQGLFLQPQHFQQYDLYTASLTGPSLLYNSSWFWGASSITFDEQALMNNVVTFSEGEFLFPDGTWVSVPDNAVLLSRNLNPESTEPNKPFIVYLGLRRTQENSVNVSRERTPEQLNEAGTRFVLAHDDPASPDLHDTGETGEVQRLNYIVKLFIEQEKENLGEYSLLPIAKLEYTGERFIRYAEYAPPSINLSGSPVLLQLARGIADQMLATCRQLEQFKVPRDSMRAQNDPAYFIYMLSLMTLNRYVPLLYHHLSAPVCHPFTLFSLFRQIIGELSSFTDRFGCLADLPDGTRLLPDYDHLDSARCFDKASELISMLLRLLITGPENTLVLERDEGGSFSVTIPLEAFENATSYYLILRTAENRERVFTAIRDVIKISSRESVAQLIARALPGLPVQYMEVPPPGIPRRADSFCYRLENSHEQWIEIQRSRSICLYWDRAPADLRIEMIIMRS